MKFVKFAMVMLLIVSAVGCTNQQQKTFKKNPVDVLIRDMSAVPSFVIILHDMDYDEPRNAYMHQYKLLVDKPEQDTVVEELTEWQDVSDDYFIKHQENMGMEIVSKRDGKVTKAVSPPGYSNYVGNEKYGQWVQRDGGSFWEFYGKYMFLSSMFRMATFPVHYGYYNDYRNNYYRTGTPYYGSHGQRTYGTTSDYNRTNSKTRWNSKSTSFKQSVRNRVARSTYSKRNPRASRNQSRYSRSSSRARSGGFGK